MFMSCYPVNIATRHKHLKLDQRKIDQARRMLGTRTEQETIDRALDAILAEARIVRVCAAPEGWAALRTCFAGSD